MPTAAEIIALLDLKPHPEGGHGERPRGVVPTGAWQGARSLGAWTLVGCTVASGFDFAGFEMAPQGWSPPGV